MTKRETLVEVARILATLSSYTQSRIISLIDYSYDTNLQLSALISPSNADVLADKIHRQFPRVNQRELYDALFASIKTAEALIDFVYKY